MAVDPATRSATVEIDVPFHDVDTAQIVWHGHYAKYFEVARCALLKTFNYNYDDMIDSGYGWPVVDMRLRYNAPCRFGQLILVTATLVEWEFRLKIDFVIRDKETGAKLCSGTTTQVAVNAETGEMCFGSPDVLFERLGIER